MCVCFDREQRLNVSATFWFKEDSEGDLIVQWKEYVLCQGLKDLDQLLCFTSHAEIDGTFSSVTGIILPAW